MDLELGLAGMKSVEKTIFKSNLPRVTRLAYKADCSAQAIDGGDGLTAAGLIVTVLPNRRQNSIIGPRCFYPSGFLSLAIHLLKHRNHHKYHG